MTYLGTMTVGAVMSVTTGGAVYALRARDYKDPPVVVFDARDGGGQTSPTITGERGGWRPRMAYAYKADSGVGGEVTPALVGDHNNRVTDYTAIIVETRQDESADRAL